MTDMFLKKFVDGGFYKEEVIDSNIANSCLHKYKWWKWVDLCSCMSKHHLQKKSRKLFLNATFQRSFNLWLIIAVIQTTWAVVKLKPEKNSGLNGIQTHDLIYILLIYIIYILYLLRVYYELTMWPATRWLDRSVGRALHRFADVMGSNLVQAWIFFRL